MNKQDDQNEKEIGQEEYDEILSQLVIRVSAMEHTLLSKGIITPDELANSTLAVMLKLEEVLKQRASMQEPVSGFIKHGNEQS